MSGAPDIVCRLPRVGAQELVRLPLEGGNTIASGAAVSGRISVPLGMAFVISALAGATVSFVTDNGTVSVNVPAGNTRIELAANATSVAITSNANSIVWTENFREP